jgi:hypothetical protein
MQYCMTCRGQITHCKAGVHSGKCLIQFKLLDLILTEFSCSRHTHEQEEGKLVLHHIQAAATHNQYWPNQKRLVSKQPMVSCDRHHWWCGMEDTANTPAQFKKQLCSARLSRQRQVGCCQQLLQLQVASIVLAKLPAHCCCQFASTALAYLLTYLHGLGITQAPRR